MSMQTSAPLAPVPPGHPLFDVIPGILSREKRLDTFHGFLASTGSVVRLRYGLKTNHVIYHPDHIKYVLQDHYKNYPKSSDYKKLRPLMGQGLITSDGELWVRQRKLMQPHFHLKQIAKLADTMVAATDAMLDDWRQATEPVDVADAMMRLTLRIIANTMFGTDVAGQEEAVGRAVPVALDDANRRMLTIIGVPHWIPTPRNVRVQQAVDTLDRVVYGIIQGRREHPEDRGDMLSMLLAAQDEETGLGMSDQQLRDEVMTIFLAGHETTANALSWTWHLLAGHPEVEAQLHEELAQVLGDRPPRFEDLPQLRYTTLVLEEAMRLYPPVWYLERQAVKADEIGGYAIHEGSEVAVIPYVTHRHPEFWDRPETFDPERTRPEHRFAYLPFGAGPRACAGNHFAMMEAKIIVAMVAQAFRLHSVPGHRIAPNPSITLRPRYGLPMRLERRPQA